MCHVYFNILFMHTRTFRQNTLHENKRKIQNEKLINVEI